MTTNADAFFTGAAPGSRTGGEPGIVNGRYVLADPETGTSRSWTRASNIGSAIADHFGLNRWRMRRLLIGLSQRPDLLDLLRVMVEPENPKLDEIVSTALEVAGHTESANRGTTVHEVQRRVHLGHEIPAGMEHYADAYRAALAKYGLTPVASELRVINRGLGAAGRLDVLYREADGSLVVGDTKSTDHLELAVSEFAAQLSVYTSADWIETSEGNWERMPEVRQDYAVVVHVDRDSGAVSLYRVDMRLGAYAANLATQVREWRTTKGILLPYVAPAGGPGLSLVSQVQHPSPVMPPTKNIPVPTEHATYATVPEGLSITYAQPATDPTPQYPNAGLEGQHPSGVSGATAVSSPTVVATQEAVTALAAAVPLRPAAELTKMSKAAVQQYLRDHGMPEDLAHTKAILIARAVQHGKVSDPVGAQQAPIRPFDQPDPLNATTQPPPEDIPGSPEFDAKVMEAIHGATSVARLGAIHQSVIRAGGDQAWNDTMTEAARAAANDLDSIGVNDPYAGSITRVLECQSQEDLAKLWSELTVGGSRPEGWPTAVDQAARQRLTAIQASAPAAPNNPFGN